MHQNTNSVHYRPIRLVATALLLVSTASQADGETSLSSTSDAALQSMFAGGALAEPITTVDCTLSDGRLASCYRIVTAGTPADASVGPFCPRTIDDAVDGVGIWFDGGESIYDVDGEFIVNLPEIYGDANWQVYDPESRRVFCGGPGDGPGGDPQPPQ